MNDILGHLHYARVYIKDILITSDGSFQDHMDKLTEVLDLLQKAGFCAKSMQMHCQ